MKECDRLDARASEIYLAVQENIDVLTAEGVWQEKTSLMNSNQYGDLITVEPYDFRYIAGMKWSDANKDPKAHSYYSVTFDPADNEDSCSVIELLITDDIMALIGNGSAVIEYDVITGKVYSVWYSEEPGCHVIVTGRLQDRADRLRMKEGMEGYSTGGANV